MDEKKNKVEDRIVAAKCRDSPRRKPPYVRQKKGERTQSHVMQHCDDFVTCNQNTGSKSKTWDGGRILTCRKAGVSEAVGSDGLDRLSGLKSELLTKSVGMISSPRGFFDVLPL